MNKQTIVDLNIVHKIEELEILENRARMSVQNLKM